MRTAGCCYDERLGAAQNTRHETPGIHWRTGWSLMKSLETEELKQLLLKCWMTHDAMWFRHCVEVCGIEKTNRPSREPRWIAAWQSTSRTQTPPFPGMKSAGSSRARRDAAPCLSAANRVRAAGRARLVRRPATRGGTSVRSGGRQRAGRYRQHPLAYARVHGETRRAPVHRFPYAIYFRAMSDELVVLAVMHGRRLPRRWRSRR